MPKIGIEFTMLDVQISKAFVDTLYCAGSRSYSVLQLPRGTPLLFIDGVRYLDHSHALSAYPRKPILLRIVAVAAAAVDCYGSAGSGSARLALPPAPDAVVGPRDCAS